MPIVIDSIHRYPIKGLKGDCLEKVDLIENNGIRHDRRFGLAFTESSGLLAGSEKWQPWQYFVSLKKYELLANLRATIVDDDNRLVVYNNDEKLTYADIDNPKEKEILAQTVADYLGVPHLQLIDSKDKPLWDDGIILTAVNTNTVKALLGDVTQVARFRPNIVLSGMAAWEEEAIQSAVSIGDCVLLPQGGVPRCAATWVNPQTAQRDKKVPELIYKARGHTDLGIFAIIQKGGSIAKGMEIHIESTA